MNRPLFLATLTLAAACGGNVIVDTPPGAGGSGTGGAPGFGGSAAFGGGIGVAGASGVGGFVTDATVGPGGFSTSEVSTCASTSSGEVFTCTGSTCSIGSDGSCSCTGACTNGDMAAASCPGNGGECTCSLNSDTTAFATSCPPNGASNPCDFSAGCCAQFF